MKCFNFILLKCLNGVTTIRNIKSINCSIIKEQDVVWHYYIHVSLAPLIASDVTPLVTFKIFWRWSNANHKNEQAKDIAYVRKNVVTWWFGIICDYGVEYSAGELITITREDSPRFHFLSLTHKPLKNFEIHSKYRRWQLDLVLI